LEWHESIRFSCRASKSRKFLSHEPQQSSRIIPPTRSDDIVDALVKYDGQYNDSRMNVSLALTAAVYGATVLNRVQVLVWKRIQME
jgi:glycerol-3-phosphate dehydrogenase